MGNITNTETTNFNPKSGYQFNLEAQFGEKVYFQSGISYVKKSNKILNPLQLSESLLHVHSVKIPAFVGYRFAHNQENKIKFHVFTGPSIHLITSIKHNEEQEELQLGDDELHDVEWTWTFGGGIQIKSFFFELGLEKGLTYTLIAYPVKRTLIFSNVGYQIKF
jgi:hypothetical protein